MKRKFTLTLALLVVAASLIVSGCGGKEDAAKELQDCRQAVIDYSREGGYLRFKQEVAYDLNTGQGDLHQKISIDGNIVLPERESYEYRETVTSSAAPNQGENNSFSYLTLDGGKTAFAKGERLSSELGVVGWVHYTPQAGQNRYFDFLKLMDRLTSAQGNVETLGYEDVGGANCVHIRCSLNGKELLDLRLQEDPTLAEKYKDIDMSQLLGDLQVEIWIGQSDNLPRRALMDETFLTEENLGSSSHFRLDLSNYHEVPLVPIEQPAFYNEAQ